MVASAWHQLTYDSLGMPSEEDPSWLPSAHPCVNCPSAVRPPVQPPVHPSACPSVQPYAHPAIRPSGHPAIRPPVRPPVCASAHLCVPLFMFPLPFPIFHRIQPMSAPLFIIPLPLGSHAKRDAERKVRPRDTEVSSLSDGYPGWNDDNMTSFVKIGFGC